MENIQQETAPRVVESIDASTESFKKVGKAKRMAKKLRSSFSRKSRESIDSLRFDEGTPSPKDGGKEKTKSKARALMSSSFKKLKRKLSLVKSVDGVEISGQSGEGSSTSQEVGAEGFNERQESLQAAVEEVVNAYKESLKEEPKIGAKTDQKIVEDVPEKKQIEHDVDGSESDSTSCPPTPDVVDDKATTEKVSLAPHMGNDNDAVESSPVVKDEPEEIVMEIVETPELLPTNNDLVSHVVTVGSNIEDEVVSVEVGDEKSSDAVLADEDVKQEEGVTVQSRAIDITSLKMALGSGEQTCASEAVQSPVTGKRGRRVRFFGAAGAAAGAAIFVARIVAAR